MFSCVIAYELTCAISLMVRLTNCANCLKSSCPGQLRDDLWASFRPEDLKKLEVNWANRTIWTGDNLSVMRGMNSESVDLIYLDPPFNSNRDYAAPIGSKAAGAAFKDTWTLDDVDLAWHGEIAEQNPAVYAVIDAGSGSIANSPL